MVIYQTVSLKRSEKGYEHCSDRGFGDVRRAKMERKPVLGGPQGYAVGAAGAFRTISLRSRMNKLVSTGKYRTASPRLFLLKRGGDW